VAVSTYAASGSDSTIGAELEAADTLVAVVLPLLLLARCCDLPAGKTDAQPKKGWLEGSRGSKE
jgi:hypothetical protein